MKVKAAILAALILGCASSAIGADATPLVKALGARGAYGYCAGLVNEYGDEKRFNSYMKRYTAIYGASTEAVYTFAYGTGYSAASVRIIATATKGDRAPIVQALFKKNECLDVLEGKPL